MPRPFEPFDLEHLLAINNANAPAVNALTELSLTRLAELSGWTRVLDDDEGPAAFLLGLGGPGLEYESENYRWFSERYPRFLYVDRVAVAPRVQGRGLGSRLYHAFIDHARSIGIDTVCAEVNIRPANPGSLRFHERHGFATLGEQETKGGSVRVRMLARDLTAGPPGGPTQAGVRD